ncbi:MAG: flagellar hook-basal body complex protein [Melioribacteraceae bacterium]|nr:MAG: flagellar hook-basal body complex protein [Melioribacteraceae bacterium]
MSLLNSLFSGVSGLKNHQTMLDVIGNNIANVNSIGFKGSRVTFSDTFNQFVRSGTNPTSTSGGTNAYQVGLGMKLNSVDRNWNQGTFERTGITTDLALQGEGLFILESNGSKFFSRAGAFTFDANGNLVNPQNGAIVQGKMATSDGVIPPGNSLQNIQITTELKKLAAVATSETTWGGNLDSTSPVTRSENVVDSGNLNSATVDADPIVTNGGVTIYDDNGNAYTLTVSYDKTAAANTWDMTWDITDSTGASVASSAASSAVVFDANGDVLTIGGAAPAVIPITNTTLNLNFNLDITAITQTSGTNTVSATADDNRESTIVNGTVTVFDSLGKSHSLSIKFTKTADNNWNWNASVPSSSGTLTNASGTVIFDTDGSIKSTSASTVTFAPAGGASSQNINLRFGEVFSGITQTSSDSVVSALSQNGSSSATLSDVSIDNYGVIVGVYSNGYSKNLAQIMVATFANRSALAGQGENMYVVSANSGDPIIGEPGETTNSTIQSGALEQSNVDLSEEFTKMIVSQRGFQANARVITVSDSMLQETTNLVR